jgi:hypothetical protein
MVLGVRGFLAQQVDKARPYWRNILAGISAL